MLPQSGAVHAAMESLPHSSATVIRMTVTEDGIPADAVVTQSAGSVVLDEYAMRCVEAGASTRQTGRQAGERCRIHSCALPFHDGFHTCCSVRPPNEEGVCRSERGHRKK